MLAVKIKVGNITILFFSLFFSLAVFYQVAAKPSPKPTYDVGFGLNKADWLYYKSNNDLSAYLGKKSSNLPTVRYQKGADYLEFSMTRVSSTTAVSLETDTKTPNTPTLFYRNIMDGTDANYRITKLPFSVKEEIVLKETFPTSLVGKGADLKFFFSAETTGRPVKQKDGSIAFFDNQNKYLFQLDKPFMVDAKGNRSEEVKMEIIPTKTKNTSEEMFFGDSSLERNSDSRLPPNEQFNGIKSFVNGLKNKYVDNKKVLDLGGIEPPDSQVATWSPRQARPRTKLFYHKNRETEIITQYQIILKADSDWLSAATYPVIIDPTITHNADANFTGQMDRIADNDSTSSTQLESSYPEATLDPYTVLLLHFNEANGTTVGIRDYASTTRVITANGNASTTNYVTQLGMGNSAAFDGTGDYLTVPDSADWDFGSGDFTIDFWFKTSSTTPAGRLLSQSDGTNYSTYFAVLANNGKLNFASYTSASNWDITSNRGSLYDGNWHHVVGVRNGSNIVLYIDGISEATGTFSGTISDVANVLRIGSYKGSASDFYYDGYIDDVRILNGRALTPEEIKAAAARRPYAVYTSSVLDAAASVAWNTLNWTEGGVNTGDGEQPYNTNSLVAQWDFNDTSGTTLTASSSGSCTTSCNGTLTNFAYTASQDQATTTTGWTANNKKWGAGALMMESAAAADYVSITDPASNVLDPNSADLTIETWIKTSDTSAEIFSNNNANGTACTNNGYYLGVDANGYPVFYLDTNGATAGCDASTTSQFKINDGSWHKVSVAVTRGTSAVIYVDGKSAGSDASVTSYSAITVTGNVYFGGSAGGLDAILDSARFYSRALSAAEILSNYQAGNIEIQTRTGATSDPNDGTWEAWKPTTGETQLLSMDSDAANWRSDIMASTTIATSTDTVIKMEGTGSLKVKMGMASTTAGTVALWHFEETGTTTGTYLYDETANNNDATTTGTTVVDGIFGKGRYFDGVDDNLTVLDSTNWAFGTGDFTVEVWAKPDNILSNAAFLINTTNTGAGRKGWRFMNCGAGSASLCFYAGTADTSNDISENAWAVPGGAPPTGVWSYYVVTRAGGTLTMYYNGKSFNSTTGVTGNIPQNGNVNIGCMNDNTGSPNCNSRSKGSMDELRILKGRALSADEIAEAYRMGANHHLTRQVSATDMSSANKLAFNVAADRPGTYLEAMLGESDYANYELASSTLALSTTTVLYIKGDEIASSTSIKDSSFSGKAVTANGNARTSGNGKIGNSLYFDNTAGAKITISDSTDWDFTGDATIDFWINPITLSNIGSNSALFSQTANALLDSSAHYAYYDTSDPGIRWNVGGNLTTGWITNVTLSLNEWAHIALIKNGSTFYIYKNGILRGSTTGTINSGISASFVIGPNNQFSTNGNIDEFRIIKGTALSADQIRQAYEYGLRSHQITIDFGATLQLSDLISNSTDYNFSITATTSGLSATTSGLYLGDKIIIKENLGGTEYTAQGTVNAINTTTGAITVPSWDTGSTFPSGNGYSPNATVFKWQREYFDLGGAATTTRNAITNLTLRPTNGAEGRTVWLDDFRYNTNYLTASSSSAITSSNGRYLQYRAIFSSWDSFVSPYLSALNALYTSTANMFPPAIGVSGGGFLSF